MNKLIKAQAQVQLEVIARMHKDVLQEPFAYYLNWSGAVHHAGLKYSEAVVGPFGPIWVGKNAK